MLSLIWRTALLAALLASGLNLIVLLLARRLGAGFLIEPPGAGPMAVGAVDVVLVCVLAVALGAGVLWRAALRGPRAWRATGWVGLAVGGASMAVPLTAPAAAPTSAALASMHLIAGAAWCAVVLVHAKALAPRSAHEDRAGVGAS